MYKHFNSLTSIQVVDEQLLKRMPSVWLVTRTGTNVEANKKKGLVEVEHGHYCLLMYKQRSHDGRRCKAVYT